MNTLKKLNQLGYYIGSGWKIFPVNWIVDGRCSCGRECGNSKGKHPLTEHGFLDASNDLEQIVKWFSRNPNANWGVATGEPSKIVVIDIDPGKGGEIESLGTLAETLSVKTGGGGLHLYFKWPGYEIKSSVSKIADGIDIRGDGACAIIPPSVHASGNEYEFDGVFDPSRISDLPESLLKIISSDAKTEPGIGPRPKDRPENIPHGQRDDFLFKQACALRDTGLEVEEIVPAIKVVYERRCEKVESDPITESDLERIAKSACKYIPENVPELAGEDFLISATDLLSMEFQEPHWVIPEILPVGLTLLAGKPKAGKSLLALQIAKAVSHGSKFFNNEVDKRPVLFIAFEDTEERLYRRMRRQEWLATAKCDFLPLGKVHNCIGDLKAEGKKQLTDLIVSRGYGLVVIDTLSRAFSGNQNSVEEMTSALEPVQEIAHKHNCSVLVIDHHRKGIFENPDTIADVLGSTAKGAMADSIWGLYRQIQKASARLSLIGRDFESKSFALNFSSEELQWVLEGPYGEVTQYERLTENHQNILDAVKELGPSRLTNIAQYVDKDSSNTRARILKLIKIGRLGVSKETDTPIYYLPNDSSSVQEPTTITKGTNGGYGKVGIYNNGIKVELSIDAIKKVFGSGRYAFKE